jgi:methylated-DNA-[protein]-cysteine S-methyltransferase
MKLFKTRYLSPIGPIVISGTENGISNLEFSDSDVCEMEHPHLRKCKKELDAYFKGTLKNFSVPIDLSGSEFQLKVWEKLLKIPFGRSCSYQDVLDSKRFARAVGSASNKNPLPLIIPCHRVIATDGKMTGYAGGLWRKEWLLKHEGILFL